MKTPAEVIEPPRNPESVEIPYPKKPRDTSSSTSIQTGQQALSTYP